MVKKEQMAVLLEGIASGLSISDSVTLAHIGRATFYRRMQEDPKFKEQVEDALVRFKQRQVARIQLAGGKQWQASAWLLERKFPEEYAFTTKADITSGGKSIVEALGKALGRKHGPGDEPKGKD